MTCYGSKSAVAAAVAALRPQLQSAFVSASPGSVKFDERLVRRTDGVGEASARSGPRQSMIAVKPKFHYADFPETSPDGEVSGQSA